MLKKAITFTDFNDEEVTEDFFFHLSKAELVELEVSQTGGLSEWLQRVVDAEDGKSIIEQFKKIILSAYGKRSNDGRRFTKNQQLRDEFESSEAYSTLFMELVTDPEAAAAFVNGIIPSNMASEVAKLTALQAVPDPPPVEPEIEQKQQTQVLSQEDLAKMTPEELSGLGARIAAGEVKLS